MEDFLFTDSGYQIVYKSLLAPWIGVKIELKPGQGNFHNAARACIVRYRSHMIHRKPKVCFRPGAPFLMPILPPVPMKHET